MRAPQAQFDWVSTRLAEAPPLPGEGSPFGVGASVLRIASNWGSDVNPKARIWDIRSAGITGLKAETTSRQVQGTKWAVFTALEFQD